MNENIWQPRDFDTCRPKQLNRTPCRPEQTTTLFWLAVGGRQHRWSHWCVWLQHIAWDFHTPFAELNRKIRFALTAKRCVLILYSFRLLHIYRNPHQTHLLSTEYRLELTRVDLPTTSAVCWAPNIPLCWCARTYGANALAKQGKIKTKTTTRTTVCGKKQ